MAPTPASVRVSHTRLDSRAYIVSRDPRDRRGRHNGPRAGKRQPKVTPDHSRQNAPIKRPPPIPFSRAPFPAPCVRRTASPCVVEGRAHEPPRPARGTAARTRVVGAWGVGARGSAPRRQPRSLTHAGARARARQASRRAPPHRTGGTQAYQVGPGPLPWPTRPPTGNAPSGRPSVCGRRRASAPPVSGTVGVCARRPAPAPPQRGSPPPSTACAECLASLPGRWRHAPLPRAVRHGSSRRAQVTHTLSSHFFS